MNSNGPIKDPCGTPCVIFPTLEYTPSDDKYCDSRLLSYYVFRNNDNLVQTGWKSR